MSVARYVVTPNSRLDGANDSASHRTRPPQVGMPPGGPAADPSGAAPLSAGATSESPVTAAGAERQRHRQTAHNSVIPISSP